MHAAWAGDTLKGCSGEFPMVPDPPEKVKIDEVVSQILGENTFFVLLFNSQFRSAHCFFFKRKVCTANNDKVMPAEGWRHFFLVIFVAH